MKNTIEYHNKVINQINKTINILTEQSDEERKRDVEEIRSDIDYLRSLLNVNSGIDFKKINIRFDEEYQLKLPKYGFENFDRNLKGDMYFKVIGGSLNQQYIDIKTNSFPKEFKIRLLYETLDIGFRQMGEAYLIYSSGSEYLEGDKTKRIKFKIIDKK